MPALLVSAGLALAGVIYLALPPLIRFTVRQKPSCSVSLVWLILFSGLLARLVLFTSEPILEDDYQRYLWDGAVTGHTLNPYAFSPNDAKTAEPSSALGQIAGSAGPVLDRINHPELRTLYPPVAQALFTASYQLLPWSLNGWRIVCLVSEITSAALILKLLRGLDHSPLWLAIYWWNPLEIKEAINSAHVDVVAVPMVLCAIMAALRGRPLVATISLLLGAGVKLWPVLLLPVVWRHLYAKVGQWLIVASLSAFLLGVAAIPILVVGLDENSGFVAFATTWATNSALFLAIKFVAQLVLSVFECFSARPESVARWCVAMLVVATSLAFARRPSGNRCNLLDRIVALVAVIFFLSPTQFPWYYLWLLPVLAIRPIFALLMPTATLPLCYSAFYFLSHGMGDTYRSGIVWVIWLPVWTSLAFGMWRLGWPGFVRSGATV